MAWRRQRGRALDLAVLQAETAHLQVDTLRTELTELHRELARRDVELISALTRVAAVTDRLRLQTEEDRAGRVRLARAIELLGMFAAGPVPTALASRAPTAAAALSPSPNGHADQTDGPAAANNGAGRIIGGSVDPGRAAPPTADDRVIDLTAELPIAPTTRAERPLQCEVHLQFGDRWIDGFQIEETVRDGDVTQFRLRRRVDGWVLPELFAESEVRVFMQPVVDPEPVRQVPPATSNFRA